MKKQIQGEVTIDEVTLDSGQVVFVVKASVGPVMFYAGVHSSLEAADADAERVLAEIRGE